MSCGVGDRTLLTAMGSTLTKVCDLLSCGYVCTMSMIVAPAAEWNSHTTRDADYSGARFIASCQQLPYVCGGSWMPVLSGVRVARGARTICAIAGEGEVDDGQKHKTMPPPSRADTQNEWIPGMEPKHL